jgi:hypothetical protein
MLFPLVLHARQLHLQLNTCLEGGLLVPTFCRTNSCQHRQHCWQLDSKERSSNMIEMPSLYNGDGYVAVKVPTYQQMHAFS